MCIKSTFLDNSFLAIYSRERKVINEAVMMVPVADKKESGVENDRKTRNLSNSQYLRVSKKSAKNVYFTVCLDTLCIWRKTL